MSDSRAGTSEDGFEATLIEVDETVVVTSATAGGEGAQGPAPHTAASADDIDGMSYERARDALVEVVDRLERGGTTLEESLSLWERGEALAARCETWLIGARARLDAARGTPGEA